MNEALARELDEAFRATLREYRINGELSPIVAGLIRDVDKITSRPMLSVEAIAEAIDRNGGFARVGKADAVIQGHYVPAERLVDALLFKLRTQENDNVA